MSKQILLVDDDLYIRELYEELLEAEDYEVETASDGKEGLDKIQENSYDLILLDIMLPKIDGIGIISKLKETNSRVPLKSIVFLTNLAQDPVVREALDTGVHSCLVKADITPDQLLAHVKEALGEKPSSPQKKQPQPQSESKAEIEPEAEPEAEPEVKQPPTEEPKADESLEAEPAPVDEGGEEEEKVETEKE